MVLAVTGCFEGPALRDAAVEVVVAGPEEGPVSDVPGGNCVGHNPDTSSLLNALVEFAVAPCSLAASPPKTAL